MFFERTEIVDESAVRRLISSGVVETIDLEFKGALTLSQMREKRELARDCAAMANSAGGQILYGVTEGETPTGDRVANEIVPLDDGTVEQVVWDVLANAIHPRVVPTLRKIPIAAGGFVLIVAIDPSDDDLHMVCAYDDFKYYKRGPKGRTPMTESEVRDAYSRILSTRASVESGFAIVVTPELGTRADTNESILVVPWYPRSALFDPRVVRNIPDLARAAVEGSDLSDLLTDLRLRPNGWETQPRADGIPQYSFLRIREDGLIHLSLQGALSEASPGARPVFRCLSCLHRLIVLLLIARALYRHVGYRSRVRVIYNLRPKTALVIDPTGPWLDEVPAQELYVQVDASLEKPADFARVAKEILDRVYQLRGRAESPYFDERGVFKVASAVGLPQSVRSMLDAP